MRQHFNPLKLEFRIYIIYYNDLITLWILWTNNLFSKKIEFKKKKNSGVHYFASFLESFFLSLISRKIHSRAIFINFRSVQLFCFVFGTFLLLIPFLAFVSLQGLFQKSITFGINLRQVIKTFSTNKTYLMIVL